MSVVSTFLSQSSYIDHLSPSRKVREGEDGERGSGLIDYTPFCTASNENLGRGSKTKANLERQS